MYKHILYAPNMAIYEYGENIATHPRCNTIKCTCPKVKDKNNLIKTDKADC